MIFKFFYYYINNLKVDTRIKKSYHYITFNEN